MLTPADKLRAQYAPNDSVSFTYRNKTLKGLIVRTNPKRAMILVEQQEYIVPYERLIPPENSTSQREERIESIHQHAVELIHTHGLKKWKFKFDHSTRRAGCCNYRDKLISISFNLAIHGSDNDIRDTILHEIAHALIGKKHHHNAVWKTKAQAIGCSGERCHHLVFSPPRYNVTCENQCWTHTAERCNPKLICRTCSGKLIYSDFTQ